MIDVHCHLVYEVDDGSKNKEETIIMLEEAKRAGFTDIILTPHYMQDYYIEPSAKIKEKIDTFYEDVKNIGINLYQGNEIYATRDIVDLIKDSKAMSLNNSRYVLFELPMQDMPMNLDEIIYLLLENKYIPIIAHPERYRYVQENPNILIEYIEKGVLFQSNLGSIIGVYGNTIKETVKKLLTHNMIHFLGTDNHRPNTIYRDMPEIITNLNKLIGEEKQRELTTTNPMRILENKDIDIDTPAEIKKSLFKFWK